ncbi:MAG: 16S rRNA (uracil(1498)-N(3))-methyltransferase [Sphingobacteriales bacterium]|nr:16S rRNA (uracil(1498)-N(3))-methyltransferase [Sphingobacteriales bacterium]
MALPFFYAAELTTASTQYVLNEETSKHVVQVLRMKLNEELQLTDGKGNLFIATIIDDNRKRCLVKIVQTTFTPQPEKKITIAISLVKNNARFEWFLEKATEIGIQEIIPLVCSRTEKQHFRHDRMNGILISAMLQSQQTWLPVLYEATKFSDTIKQAKQEQKLIAHCEEEVKTQLSSLTISNNTIILIGPEGDFTKEEIDIALQNNFTPVALGDTRLRTETAGIVATTLLRNM